MEFAKLGKIKSDDKKIKANLRISFSEDHTVVKLVCFHGNQS